MRVGRQKGNDFYLALRHGVEVHPLRIKDQIGWDSAAFVDGDVAVLESSSAASISFDVFHHNLFYLKIEN